MANETVKLVVDGAVKAVSTVVGGLVTYEVFTHIFGGPSIVKTFCVNKLLKTTGKFYTDIGITAKGDCQISGNKED